METQYLGLLIFGFVVALLGAYYFGKNRKKYVPKNLADSRAPYRSGDESMKPQLFVFKGGVNPENKSKTTAKNNCHQTRNYYTVAEMRVGTVLYNGYPDEPTKGGGKWICLTAVDEKKWYCRVHEDGTILSCSK